MKGIEKNQIHKNEDGFTLIEVLIAIAILSVLMTAIYTIVDSSVNTNDRVTKEDRERLQLEIGMMRIERDIELINSPLYYESSKADDNKAFAKAYNSSQSQSQSRSRLGGSSQQQQQQQQQSKKYVMTTHLYKNKNFDNLSAGNVPIPILLNEEKGSLVFLSSANRRLVKNMKQSNLMWVRYRVVTTSTDGQDEEEKNTEAPYSLTRTVIPVDIYNKDLDWEKAKEYPVIENLRDFSFEFYSPEKEKFVSSLRELNKLRNTPRLIRMNIDYVSKNGDELQLSRTIRVMWPEFNSSEDLKEKYDFKK
ncbi:prepilin-type N-terminal cleavage/methylation domain-containing protein [Halobacteriovorax sp. ZH4_bin.1]|uniref:PulJ/GspJ family protein n=1 Tax=unclassified Halobacteriovorax TaxID=2639665 RepID=UPI003721B562